MCVCVDICVYVSIMYIYSPFYLHVHSWVAMMQNVTHLRRLALDCSWHVIKRERIHFRTSFYT